MVTEKQAGLLAQASSFSKPSQFPSGNYGELHYYSGVTARDFNPTSLFIDYAFVIKNIINT
jgi:hypothetical protein